MRDRVPVGTVNDVGVSGNLGPSEAARRGGEGRHGAAGVGGRGAAAAAAASHMPHAASPYVSVRWASRRHACLFALALVPLLGGAALVATSELLQQRLLPVQVDARGGTLEGERATAEDDGPRACGCCTHAAPDHGHGA